MKSLCFIFLLNDQEGNKNYKKSIIATKYISLKVFSKISKKF